MFILNKILNTKSLLNFLETIESLVIDKIKTKTKSQHSYCPTINITNRSNLDRSMQKINSFIKSNIAYLGAR